MIQRIQTIYLVLAVVAVVLCMCNPIGVFRAADATPLATLYNLWLSVDFAGKISHVVMPWVALFALLAFVATMLTFSIFLFKKRALQMRVVNFSMLILVGYYLSAVGLIVFFNQQQGLQTWTGFRPSVWMGLPLVALIFSYMAFRAILKDEMLVRSLDRLR